ncbi:signal peptide containing protein [Cryptosporidium canis]|uniref:Signal peptide containing protein n=1 Tax=Cryptosporidium canis TaxID=195482 RepID=A0A9D5HV69_9CRYT|nr:signal peptide containing protein [Cryptosporidium canis]
MSKIKRLLFGSYLLVVSGVITLHYEGIGSCLLQELSGSNSLLAVFGSSLSGERRRAELQSGGISLVQLSRRSKRNKADKKREREEKKRRKQEEKQRKKDERERKKREKNEQKQQAKEMKRKDKEDEREIKNIGKRSGIPSNDIKSKIKDLKKQLKLERKTNPSATLKGLFDSSGGFGDAAGGAGDDADSNGDSTANSNDDNAGAAGRELTKEEKKQQKKQDKLDEKEILNKMVDSGMNKKEAKKKVKELKKLLKSKRKSGSPRATLHDVYNGTADTPSGGATGAQNGDIEGRVAALEARVEKLTRANKKRKAEVKNLNSNISKLAFIMKKRVAGTASGSGQGSPSSSDEDDE